MTCSVLCGFDLHPNKGMWIGGSGGDKNYLPPTFKWGWYTLDLSVSFKRFCFYLLFFSAQLLALILSSDALMISTWT